MESSPPVKPKRGRPFVKGQKGANPLGAKAHDPIKKQMKKLTTETLNEVLNEMLLVQPEELDRIVENEPTVLKKYIASAIEKGIERGDIGPLMTLIERMVGKVKENVSIESKSINVNMTPEQVKEAMERVNEKF